MTLAEYVDGQMDALIGKVADAAAHAESDTSAAGIHRLRVAIRKLAESLRVFKSLFPHGAAKKVRKDLKAAMKLAGEARNYDIARDLMKKAKVQIDPEVVEGRERALQRLAAVLHAWNQDNAAGAWRERLHG
jgi:CHAD domain-containing protein